jgi:spore maturation protein CgeB
MHVVMFYHSLISDWNHGNAHFLRGIVSDMLCRGMDVQVYEPHNAWSMQHLLAEAGNDPVADFYLAYPGLSSTRYDPDTLDVERILDDTHLVLVHEWNSPSLIQRIGRYRSLHPHIRVLFHDTHHRIVTDPSAIPVEHLQQYDGILAYGESLREQYRQMSLTPEVWVWHEAADIRIFYPRPQGEDLQDLVWIGNWGDEERSTELQDYLFTPAQHWGLATGVYGVGYPPDVQQRLRSQGIRFHGWLPNFRVPGVFADYKVTVHIPRRPYTRLLPGIPTIRPFEALACGIPLVCAPWEDTEHLFTPGKDFLIAHTPRQMQTHLRDLLQDDAMREEFRQHGLNTIRNRHTCAHRVDELLDVYHQIAPTPANRGRILVK